MVQPPSPTKMTLNLCRDCERSRLAAEALAAAYEFLTPTLRGALPSSEPTQHCPSAEPRQRLAGGQKA
jgi:hypothetical protein